MNDHVVNTSYHKYLKRELCNIDIFVMKMNLSSPGYLLVLYKVTKDLIR